MSHADNPQHRGSRRNRLVFGLTALVLAAYLLLPLVSSSTWLRSRVERAVERATGMEIEIGQLQLGYDFALHLAALSASQSNRVPFLMVERLTVGISVSGIFLGQPLNLTLGHPRLVVENLPRHGGDDRDPGSSGVDPTESAGNPAAASLPFYRVDIVDGHITTSEEYGDIGPITVSINAIQAGESARASIEIDSRLPPLEVAATVATPGEQLVLSDAHVSWRSVSMPLLAERFPALAAGISVEGTLDLSGDASGPLDSLTGRGRVGVQGFKYHSETLEISGDIDAPIKVIGGILEVEDPGMQLTHPVFTFADVSGQASQAAIVGTVKRDGNAAEIDGKLQIAGVQAHDPAFERVIENVIIEGKLKASWQPGTPPVLRIDLGVPGGEVLWDRFYADVSRHPLKVAGEVTTAPAGLSLSKIDARAAGIGTIKGSATLKSPMAIDRFAVSIDVSDLGNLYALAVREPYKESFPSLSTTAAGGGLEARIEYTTAAQGFALTGDLRVKDGFAIGENPSFELQGMNLSLPLQLGHLTGATPEAGQLAVSSLRVGEVTFGGFEAPLGARTNAIELAEPITLALLGGTLEITRLVGDELHSSQPRVALGIAVNDVNLEALTTSLDLPPLRGSLSGSIPQVMASGGQVRSEGEIRIEAFDGKIAVRNLSVDQLFSSVPTLGLDFDFEEVSLGQLTEAFEVGRISGVVRGGARNLAMASGQPLSFDAWMETVERPGVPQRISVSAIRQLSILGGSGSDPFSQGILSLFDEYRYAEMGFRCRLENDRFLLRGVKTIDGKEYLVVGSRLPPRVNVVSHNQVISFSEMVRRLQRIIASPAEAEGEKP